MVQRSAIPRAGKPGHGNRHRARTETRRWLEQAEADNARLLKAYPEGFALDATHHAHITMLQQFVRTADLRERSTPLPTPFSPRKEWQIRRLKAFKYYYISSPHSASPASSSSRQKICSGCNTELLDAVAPFTEKTGTAAAFVSTDGGRDIQQGLIDYVADFTTVAAGKKFNPHVTIGVAPETYLNEMLAEPFKAFAFSLAGAAVYQLGSFGAARKGAPSIVTDALSALDAGRGRPSACGRCARAAEASADDARRSGADRREWRKRDDAR